MRVARLGLALICTGLAIACGNNSEKNPTSPTAPSGTAESGAAADGSTLKASIPAPASPKDGARADSRRPALTFSNAVGKYQSGSYTYRVEVFEGTTSIGVFTQAQASGNQSTYTLESDLKYDTVYRWRVRGEMGGAFTAWSGLAEFRTPVAPVFGGGGGGGTGTVGANRSIGFNEAFAIILAVHNGERWNLGSGTSRESRVDFLWRAVGVIHYGHPTWNPQGGDPDWCVKDAGGGRPPSDDVLVRCSTREAWDLIGGAGANGYSFHQDYLGRLDSAQNVYPPPVPAGGGGGLPADPNRPALPDVRAQIQQFFNERPDLFSQQCVAGVKYVNSPWQDYIVDRLRQIDPRWGYNGKPTRTAADNGGRPVVAAGDELAYYYGSGAAQGSPDVYLVDILEGHCGPTPRLTWRVFTGEEPGFWTGAGRF
jgi:hypothetical protein